ncbi:Serine/threonine protein kinase PrkC, regulator of stationary phase [Minicystis rosea]|nr:Serine/threonine protein kinase PrkC, regulator of stationary phase [Minicystis rosea]
MPSPGPDPSSQRQPGRARRGLLQPGDQLGRFTIEGIVGEGGMGAVYSARDAKLGRKVALKVIAGDSDDPEAVERIKRFLREARSAAALDHPNAVSIFDVGEEDGLSFIAMELVHGLPLRMYVGTDEPDVRTRLHWLVEIAGALAAAHRARLIHRDIKPENVMIRDDGRAKVLDFGLARRTAKLPDEVTGQTAITTSTEDGSTAITAVGTLLGTPQYMAPEQIRSEPMDGRSDQFSWGVLAYELLSGTLPWPGNGLHAMARILSDAPRPLRTVCPAVPEEAAAVVMRTLSKMPADRFPSMDDVITALDAFTDPGSSGARTVPRPSMAPASRAARGASMRPPASPPENATQRSADPFAGAPLPKPARVPRVPKVEVVEAPPSAPEATPQAPFEPDGEPLRPRGLLFAAIAIIAAALSFVGLRNLRAKTPAPSPAASASSASAPRVAATTVTDLPDPKTPSPDALAAYRAGLTEVRFGGSRDAFERATVLDPSLGAAHLMYAVDAIEGELTDDARSHLRKASELRSSLTERDQLLLDSMEPVLLRQPASWAESSRRLAIAVERFPMDAQLWYEHGFVALSAEGLEPSTRYLERAVALDPKYAQAMGQEAENLMYLGRWPEARSVLDRCISIAPTFTTCSIELARLFEHRGTCDEEETMARQLVTASPAQAVAQGLLASALAARGRPEAAVREALRLKWAAIPGPARQQAEREDTLSLALLSGDFVTATELARAIEAAAEPSRHESEHGRAARKLTQILIETGRLPDAGRTAEAYLGRHDAWEPDPRSEDFALAGDATPSLLAAALRAQKLTRAELATKRAEWVRGWERKVTRDFKSYIWAHGYAGTVETADDARDALATLPAYEPLPSFFPKTLVEASVGLTFLLGGRADEALPWLTRAAKSCRVLEFPVEHTRAQLWLGQAHEAKGDKASACAAYRVVRDRWGKAKPRSITAEKAAERMRAAGCGG